jgi:hypothetical protein
MDTFLEFVLKLEGKWKHTYLPSDYKEEGENEGSLIDENHRRSNERPIKSPIDFEG